ncbi:hypothetical protein FRC08_013479 [Ceratobasidium sp. 394]|nr:hypothetical protein FRC08_013479 [Ceratobasidium sp. 394]
MPGLAAVAKRELVECPSKINQTYRDVQSLAHIVESQPLPLILSTFDPLAVDVVMADFGCSHWMHHHFKEDVQSLALYAPEVVLGHTWNQLSTSVVP